MSTATIKKYLCTNTQNIVIRNNETEVIILLLGGGIDPAAVVPAEGALLIIVGYDVLSQLRSHHLEEIAQVPNERKVTKDRMVPLQQVVDPNYEE